MKTTKLKDQESANQPEKPVTSMPVRTGLHSGAWNCNTCEGKVTGNQLFKPTCEYCQPA